jgi:hypothetical protein
VVSVALALTTPVAGLLPAARIASSLAGTGAAGAVYVLAAPDATTNSTATGSSTDTTATLVGALALNVSMDNALATTLGTIYSGAVTVNTIAPDGTFGSGGFPRGTPASAVSDATAWAGAGGVTGGATTADAQLQTWLQILTGAATSGVGVVTALLPTVTSVLPAPVSIPALPSAQVPGLDGIQAALKAAAAISSNIEVATTVASILGGTIVTSGALNVYGESHVAATSHAYAQTVTSGGGLATALAINVEVDAITAVVGGPLTVSAPSMTVEALTVLSNGDPGPAVANALAVSGGNGSSSFTRRPSLCRT